MTTHNLSGLSQTQQHIQQNSQRIQGELPPGTRRKQRQRVAKKKRKFKYNPVRGNDTNRIRYREDTKNLGEKKNSQQIARNLRLGAYISQNEALKTAEQLKDYPAGSYGSGRYLYLTRELENLGKNTSGLISFNYAPVEIDHSPSDSSQRPGDRVADEAFYYRVSVPLPRGWHRRHKTSHGPGATRTDTTFSENQKNLVQEGKYAEALQNHLVETFSPEAVGSTGTKKIQEVATYTLAALDYATTNIPESIHPKHTANTPLITAEQKTDIKIALKDKFDELIEIKTGLETNPFE
ncbi:hypothetical protein [Coleofasciculus chthonoplastes]|uniref:hypothetical protein n=1 Tax=Coleofasciculus chthonoplastes TaxID=64178 RepID=UPI0032FE4B85